MDDRKNRSDPSPDAPRESDSQPIEPAGDVRPDPNPDAPDLHSRSEQPLEDVDGRGDVGQVGRDDHPADQRRASQPDS